MSLKSAHRHTPSIGFQLTFFYSVSMFLLLLIAGFLLYLATMHILYKADYEFLSDEVDTVSYVLENKAYDKNILQQVVIDTPIHSDRSLYRYYIRIYQPNNELMIETPGMQSVLQADPVSSEAIENLKKERFIWYKKGKNQYLLIQSPIRFGKRNQIGSIEVILDVSYQHSTISDKKIFFVLILFASAASLLLGFIISFRGMRQLKHLTHEVKKMTISSLHERINPADYPSELQALADAFNEMIKNIECAVKRLQQFTGDLAHELRSPITNLIGETEMALNYSRTPDDFRLVLSSNLEELHRISSLIENILFLARAENPKQHIQKEQVDVATEVKKLIDYFEPMADEKRINLTSTGGGDCQFNKIMFDRMMSNLISNAIKYTEACGHIHVTTEQTENDIIITVSDTGVGIPAEHLPNIFKRFYRVDSSRTKSSGGIGLGLAIVKSIVDIHHGKITIESTQNHGTTVKLVFEKTH